MKVENTYKEFFYKGENSKNKNKTDEFDLDFELSEFPVNYTVLNASREPKCGRPTNMYDCRR